MCSAKKARTKCLKNTYPGIITVRVEKRILGVMKTNMFNGRLTLVRQKWKNADIPKTNYFTKHKAKMLSGAWQHNHTNYWKNIGILLVSFIFLCLYNIFQIEIFLTG